jgi:hypothetical protein
MVRGDFITEKFSLSIFPYLLIILDYIDFMGNTLPVPVLL